MIKFLVKGQNIETLEHEIIADNQVSFVNVHFVFDNNWKPLHKVVQFAQDEFVYNMVLGYDGTVCKLPSELHAGAVKMSLFGYDTSSEETVRATTVIHTLNIRPSGFDGDGGSPIPPTPDIYQQLLQKIDSATAGKSAFEIAVEHGFVGTEAEWLKSLKGADGINGKDGRDGADGKNGIDGKDGEQGPPGENGRDGKDGRDGVDGKDGKNGRDGVDGKNGIDGVDGKDGKDGITPDMSLYPTKAEILPTIESIISQLEKLPEKYATNTALTYLKSTLEKMIEAIDTELQQLRDSTQYEQQIQDDRLNLLENRVTILESQSGGEEITLFRAGNDVFDIYDLELCFMLNNGISSLIKFTEQYPAFCCGSDGYVLNYCQEAFNWAAEVYSTVAKAVKLNSNSKILMEYQSGANQLGKMYLVSTSGRSTTTPISKHIFDKISSHDCIELPFEWLQSQNYITQAAQCSEVPAGEYYLAWLGVSDNTHPKIKSVKIIKE